MGQCVGKTHNLPDKNYELSERQIIQADYKKTQVFANPCDKNLITSKP